MVVLSFSYKGWIVTFFKQQSQEWSEENFLKRTFAEVEGKRGQWCVRWYHVIGRRQWRHVKGGDQSMAETLGVLPSFARQIPKIKFSRSSPKSIRRSKMKKPHSWSRIKPKALHILQKAKETIWEQTLDLCSSSTFQYATFREEHYEDFSKKIILHHVTTIKWWCTCTCCNTRVAESEVKYPIPTFQNFRIDFLKFPTP